MSSLNAIIDNYRPISLSEMDSVALMNRVDTKYQVSRTMALEILTELVAHYQVLEINDNRKFQYLTTYFDTEDRFMLNEHLRGKLNRVKVRVREYVGSNLTFFEIKLKTNKGRTVKSRMKKIGDPRTIAPEEATFLAENSKMNAADLQPVIDLAFSRITLVSTEYKERITFDFNLTFEVENRSRSANELVIIELKRDAQGAAHSPVIKVLKTLSARPSSMSKYCMGMILFDQTERYNRYKPKLLTLNKLSADGNIW